MKPLNSNTSLLDQLLDSITPTEQHRTDNRMLIAARIDDVMQEKNISQTDLAKRLKKHHSVITQWLSGTQNFTLDTLSDIENVLGINLIQTFEPQPIVIECHFVIRQEVSAVSPNHLSDSEPFSRNNFSLSNTKTPKERAFA
jgi:transcriptional regulator with XRE-family HTH domain